MSRAGELLAWAAWLEGSGRENVAAALRAHAELLDAAEELLRRCGDDGLRSIVHRDQKAWERLREAVR